MTLNKLYQSQVLKIHLHVYKTYHHDYILVFLLLNIDADLNYFKF